MIETAEEKNLSLENILVVSVFHPVIQQADVRSFHQYRSTVLLYAAEVIVQFVHIKSYQSNRIEENQKELPFYVMFMIAAAENSKQYSVNWGQHYNYH